MENPTAWSRRLNKEGDLRRIFRERLPEAQWTSIESPLTGSGIPDAEYCFPGGISGWIEFKKTHVWNIGHLKPLQIAWIERRKRLGGRVFVAVRRNDDELWLIDGAVVRGVVERGLAIGEGIKSWGGGPSRWDWVEVKNILTSEVIVSQ